MNSCTNLDEWFTTYVTPTIEMLHTALAKDAIYAVNIADYKDGKEEFNIVEQWKQISEQVGFTYQKQIDMLLNVRPGVGNNKLENSYKSEGIYLFKKS
jgi:hypothetical protein